MGLFWGGLVTKLTHANEQSEFGCGYGGFAIDRGNPEPPSTQLGGSGGLSK